MLRVAVSKTFRTRLTERRCCASSVSLPASRVFGWFLAFILASPSLVHAEQNDSPETAERHRYFEQHVRPLLLTHCVKCHGPKKQFAGLRLDSREGMLTGGESGAAIVVHKPDESLLIEAVRRESFEMPPDNELSPAEIEKLRVWIAQGAAWPKTAFLGTKKRAAEFRSHWAFQPIRNPKRPAVENETWPHNDIDDFVLAKLEAKNLAPSKPASRRTLLRRLTWGLTGLPMSGNQLQQFLSDESPAAMSDAVDRLLASPHYGERWGRHWCDVARYADTKGYVFFEKPTFHSAFTYRDYVIDSFNDDKPFNQFVLEQLAADQLQIVDTDQNPGQNPNAATHKTLAALGFITVGPRLKNDTHDIMADRIDVVSRGFLGLTVGCARCHDHKYDPISTEDYYSLYGVFRNTLEPLHLPFREGDGIPAERQQAAKEIEQAARDLEDHYRTQYEKVIRDARTRLPEYLSVAQSRRSGPDTVLFDVIVDVDDLSPQLLQIWQQYLEDTVTDGSPVFHPWHALAAIPQAEFSQQARDTLQEMIEPEHLKSQPVNRLVWQQLTRQKLDTFDDVVRAYVSLLDDIDRESSAVVAEKPTESVEPPGVIPDLKRDREQFKQAFYGNHSPLRTPYHGFKLLRLFPDRKSQEKVKELNAAVDAARAKAPVELAQMLAVEDATEIMEPRVFQRGNPSRPAQYVERRYLRFFSEVSDEAFGQGSGRLELAEAIISPDNPLTARVIVNRVWLHHFGQGLVSTPSDFGMQSAPPSHPELLDHLTTWFVNHGWSIKELHRYVLQSATYQQQSVSRPEAEQVDPANRLLWRMNRRRLDLETMRDALLMVAGDLDLTVGGPSVKGIMDSSNRRRTIYTHVDRQNLPGVFRTFDFPPPDVSSGTRDNTTVPGQALFLMNHPLVLACSRELSEQAQSFEEKSAGIRSLFRNILFREPTAAESRDASEFLAVDEKSEPAEVVELAWQYGHGAYDVESQKLTSFDPLPHWTGSQFQGGTKLPDAELGWVFLNSEGGHPGNDLAHVAVIRWMAPQTMTVSLNGTLAHEKPKGNGIRARVAVAGKTALGPWSLHQDSVDTNSENIALKQGETIDFIVDVNGKLGYDSFRWSPEITVGSTKPQANSSGAAKQKVKPDQSWSYSKDFRASTGIGVTAWQSLAQVLLLSNEFQFVD